MKTLADYFYIECGTDVIGWVANVDMGMDILMDDCQVMTEAEKKAAEYVMAMCFKYLHQPLVDAQLHYLMNHVNADGKLFTVYEGKPDNDDPMLLGVMSPMLFKGLSAQLATLYIGGKTYFLVRRSEEQSMSLNAYLALLNADVEATSTGYFSIHRTNGPCKIKTPVTPLHYTISLPDGRRLPLSDVTAQAVIDAGVQIDQSVCEFLDVVRFIRDAIPMGLVTYPSRIVWQHNQSGNFQFGKYPTSFGRGDRPYRYVGTLLSGILSNRPGGIVKFLFADKMYTIGASPAGE